MSAVYLKIPDTGDTDSCNVCGKLHCVKSKRNIFGSNLEHLPVFKALSRADPEQNAGTIHKSNLEQLLVFKAPRGDDPRVQFGIPSCF